MKIAFVSTMSGFPWGGSEELWSAAAREALAAGDSVGLCTRLWPQQPGPLADLVARGAAWWPWPTPVPPTETPEAVGQRQDDGGRRRSPWGRGKRAEPAPPLPPPPPVDFEPIFASAPDVICISQGGTYDFLEHSDLCDLLYRSTRPYVVLSRFNTDDFPVSASERPKAVEVLTRAYHVGFAAARNLAATERQLATRLLNASIIQSPLNLPGQTVLPWPSAAVPSMACVARLDARCKGHDLLFESLAAPTWKARQWRLSLYGDGPDRSRYEELIGFFDLAERVHLAGYVSDIPAIWRDHHLLVLPSRDEGTPQSLIQAMLCGRAAVATDVGGVVEWLTEGRTGFVAEAATVSSLTRALERAWEARAAWPAMGVSAHQGASARVDPAPATALLALLRAAARSV